MQLLCVLLALLGPPYWEARAPQEWSDTELMRLFNDSPWGEAADPSPAVHVYLASARPMRDAEAELVRRKSGAPPDPDYTDFLRDDQGRHIVVAVPYPDIKALSDAAESRRMEEECVMRVGRKRYKITGHFSPTPSDPVLRLVFPRAARSEDKSMVFELYLPGRTNPYKTAEFWIKDLVYKGKPEM